MQLVSEDYKAKALSNIRHLKSRLLVSFDKNFDEDIDFFTIGVSLIGGTDIIRGDGSVIQEWDKYDYTDISARVKSIEWNRESEPPIGAITLAMADIVLDNHDDIFTPTNTASPYYGKLGAGRPVRFYIGFKGTEQKQLFVGMTEGVPVVDEEDKTVRLHCIDFLRKIQSIELNDEVILTDVTSDAAVSAILQAGGLSTSQFNLDAGSVILPFVYYKPGDKLGDALREVVEAELGALYMGEEGEIRMENRTNWVDKNAVAYLNRSNVLEDTTPDESQIINFVEVYSQARAVEAKQKLWEDASAIGIPINDSIVIEADFKDEYDELPVTSVDEPDYIGSATTSVYATNEDPDGEGDTLDSDVSLTNFEATSTGAKMTFTNTNTTKPVYITQLELWGTPAKVQSDIYKLVKDATSITNHEEQKHEVRNNFIQDEAAANSLAQIIIDDRATLDDMRLMTVKGIPHLQVGDLVNYADYKGSQNYFVVGIAGILDESGFKQQLTLAKRSINEYFRIGISLIGGNDVIAP